MTPGLIVSTSRQVRDYVFCEKCEHRLNVGGERYVMGLIAQRESFPLRDMLRDHPHAPAGPLVKFSGRAIGVDTDKIAYFAISMVWRGSVHAWKSLAGQETGSAVASHMDAMRLYLMGEISLPNDVYVFVLVCLDLISQIQAFAPFPVGGVSEQRYEMLMNGIFLHVGLGCPANIVSQVCCAHAPDRPVFAGDHHEESLKAARSFHENARIADNVPKTGNVIALVKKSP